MGVRVRDGGRESDCFRCRVWGMRSPIRLPDPSLAQFSWPWQTLETDPDNIQPQPNCSLGLVHKVKNAKVKCSKPQFLCHYFSLIAGSRGGQRQEAHF